MSISKKTTELAAKIVADGWSKFVGNGLTVEIATGRFIGPLDQLEQNMPIVVAGQTLPPLAALGRYDAGRWRAYCTIGADSTPSTRDTANADIRRAGAAGSAGRVQALARHYAINGGNERSPFSITDDEIAELVVRMLGAPIRTIKPESPNNFDEIAE